MVTLGYALFLRVQADWDYLDMLPTLVLVGVAFALVYGPLTSEATGRVPEAEQGVAGALLNTSIQFGAALGLAAVTSVLVAAGDDGPITMSGYRDALLAPALMALAATVVIASGLRRRHERSLAASRTTLPTVARSSRSWCARAASASGYVVTSGRQLPAACRSRARPARPGMPPGSACILGPRLQEALIPRVTTSPVSKLRRSAGGEAEHDEAAAGGEQLQAGTADLATDPVVHE